MAAPWEQYQPQASAGPWTKFKAAPAAPLHDMSRGPLAAPKTPPRTPTPVEAPPGPHKWTPPAGYKPTGETVGPTDRGPDTMHAGPLTSAMLDPNRPIGQRVLAGAGHVAGGMLRAGPDAIQSAVQSLRQGEQPSPETIGSGALSMLPGAMETGGKAPHPADAYKPRVEPPPLRTEPEIARNPEGRPIVPRGGLQDDEMAKLTAAFKSVGVDIESPALKAAEKIDPRAAQAGQAAVGRVADRAGATLPPPTKSAEPAPQLESPKPKPAEPTVKGGAAGPEAEDPVPQAIRMMPKEQQEAFHAADEATQQHLRSVANTGDRAWQSERVARQKLSEENNPDNFNAWKAAYKKAEKLDKVLHDGVEQTTVRGAKLAAEKRAANRAKVEANAAKRKAETASEAGPWDQWKEAFSTPEAKKGLDVQTQTIKAQLAENYYGVPAKPDKFQKQAMNQTNANPTGAAPKPAPKPAAAPIKGATPAPKPAAKPTGPKTPFDKWYEDVQKEGKHGEGLDMNLEARVKRAKSQGFDTGLTLYHGTGKSDFIRMDLKKTQSENAIFLTDDPKVAASYAHKGGAPNIIPIWSKTKNPKTVDWKGAHYSSSKLESQIKQAKAEGHDALFIKNMVDIGSGGKPQNQYAFFKPGNLRSKIGAAFAPGVKEPQAHLLSAAGTPLHELLKINKAEYEDKLPKAPGIVELAKKGVDTVKAVLAPETLSADADRAAGGIRKAIGRGVQDSERAKVAMEPYRKTLQKMDLEQQLDVLQWLQKPEAAAQKRAQSGAGTFDPPPELAKFLQGFRDLMRDRQIKLESRTKTGDMSFKDDYVTQMWRDPDAARDLLHTLGPKEGSNAFTKRSVIEDYAAGIKAGLIPLTTDPIEIAMRYVENVDRFVAINDVLEEGVANKDIVWRTPEHAPNGWVKLDGRAKSFKGGAFEDAYAPPGYAAVYNAFVSKPPSGPWGDLLSGAQKVANSVSAFKLAVSGYHALNIAGEANVAGLANAIDKLAGGDVLGAAAGAVGSPAKFVTSVARGRQMLNTYISGMGSPEMQKVVQLAVDANFRIAGKGRVADEYRFSALGSLYDSFKKGLLKGELKAMGKDIADRPVVGTAKSVVGLAARALETLSDPLFKYYIPMVKNGAYFDMVKTWLDAHPTASSAEQAAFARKASDIIDNRFGEMNQDNIFWQRWQKQLAQTLVVSYSYELGTARIVSGAAKDAAGLAKGKGWSPNLSYAIALPVMIGMMGAAYQYIKTGKPPEGATDAMYPRTGGTDPMSGQQARAVLPSYMSQFVNAYFGGLTHEIANKKNGVFDLLNAAFTGTDWRGDPITAVDDPTTTAIRKWLEYAAGAWEPILASQTKKGGTGISGGERFMGIREAPMFANDPQAFKRMTDARRLQQDAEKAWHDHNAALEAKGQHPNFYVKRKFIQNYIANHKPSYKGTVQ